MPHHAIDKQTLKHDPFRDAMFALVDYMHQRRNLFILLGSALLLIVAAGAGWYGFSQYYSRWQSEAFAKVETVLADTKLSKDERARSAQAALEEFLKNYPRGALAPIALSYQGRLAFEQGRLDKAEQDFQQVLEHGQTTPALRVLALTSLGKLREAQGKPQEAEAIYNRIEDKGFEALKAYNVGRAQLAQNKTEQARTSFTLAAQGTGTVSQWAREALEYLP
jgi:predicted negative regulator of RcsB-dependent stress response